MCFATFDALSSDLLIRKGVDVVISALWTDEFDVIDLAGKLSLLGYTGRFRAVTTGVPRPQVIVSDVRRAYPFLDFRILIYSGSGNLTRLTEYDDQP